MGSILEYHYCVNRDSFNEILLKANQEANPYFSNYIFDLVNDIRVSITIDDKIPTISKINKEIVNLFLRAEEFYKENCMDSNLLD